MHWSRKIFSITALAVLLLLQKPVVADAADCTMKINSYAATQVITMSTGQAAVNTRLQLSQTGSACGSVTWTQKVFGKVGSRQEEISSFTFTQADPQKQYDVPVSLDAFDPLADTDTSVTFWVTITGNGQSLRSSNITMPIAPPNGTPPPDGNSGGNGAGNGNGQPGAGNGGGVGGGNGAGNGSGTGSGSGSGPCGKLQSVYDKYDGAQVASTFPKYCTAASAVKRVLQIAFSLAGAVAVLYIILGGFRYIIANGSGNAEGAKKAKSSMLYAVIGLIVIIMATALVTIISNLVIQGKLF
jgi:hypothetical protein